MGLCGSWVGLDVQCMSHYMSQVEVVLDEIEKKLNEWDATRDARPVLPFLYHSNFIISLFLCCCFYLEPSLPHQGFEWGHCSRQEAEIPFSLTLSLSLSLTHTHTQTHTHTHLFQIYARSSSGDYSFESFSAAKNEYENVNGRVEAMVRDIRAARARDNDAGRHSKKSMTSAF